jgi:hypothetical protein
MMRAGRKPLGPALVQHLNGSERAKQRLELILETIAGRLTIEEACRQLGIEHTMFYELRTDMLKAGLARLEPRPTGRPRRPTSIEDLHSAELQSRVEQLEAELKLSAVREEIARVMPYRAEADPPVKKTTDPPTATDRRRSARHRKSRRR